MRKDGFTLAELLIALAISVFVVAGICVAFVSQVQEYRRYRDSAETGQNVRAAAEMLTRDARTAGYGVAVPRSQISTWITWVSGMTNTIVVQNGASGASDRIFMAGAFSAPVASVSSSVSPGNTTIQVQSGEGAKFDTTRRKLAYVGRAEMVRIISVAGDILTVTTSPTMSNRGVKFAYPVGTPIELIEVIEYRCETSFTNRFKRPYLIRNNNQGVQTNAIQQMAVMGIEDIQARISGRGLSVALTGVAQRPEYRYVHPVKNDGYRRIAVNLSINTRNPAR